MISINQLLLSLVVLVGPGDAAPSPSDCAELSRALKDREDIYWKVYKGRLAGDHLAEGRKLDSLRDQLRDCGKSQQAPAVSPRVGDQGPDRIKLQSQCENSRSLPLIRKRCDAAVRQWGAKAMESDLCRQAQDVRQSCAEQVEAAGAEAELQRRFSGVSPADRDPLLSVPAISPSVYAVADPEDPIRRAALAKKARVAVPVLSLFICHNIELRRAAKKEITEELRYAREGGGIVDRQKLYENQEEMRFIDQKNAEIVALIKHRFRQQPMPCTKKMLHLRADSSQLIPAIFDDTVMGLAENAPWFLDR